MPKREKGRVALPRDRRRGNAALPTFIFLPIRCPQFPPGFVRDNFHRASSARENHGNYFLRQTFVQGAAGVVMALSASTLLATTHVGAAAPVLPIGPARRIARRRGLLA